MADTSMLRSVLRSTIATLQYADRLIVAGDVAEAGLRMHDADVLLGTCKGLADKLTGEKEPTP
jgi:hypothetical protein